MIATALDQIPAPPCATLLGFDGPVDDFQAGVLAATADVDFGVAYGIG